MAAWTTVVASAIFPEVVASLSWLKAERFVLDGELVIPGQSFETLQLRLYPAERRIRELSGKVPARLTVLDLLADETGSLVEKPLFSAVPISITGACCSSRSGGEVGA
jgi:ATP-dependent DNA ligase